jgi:hypothetical protein
LDSLSQRNDIDHELLAKTRAALEAFRWMGRSVAGRIKPI